MYDELEKAIKCLELSRKYVEQAHDEAEAKHDDYGDLYMDDGLYRIMQETEKLLNEIDIAVSDFKKL